MAIGDMQSSHVTHLAVHTSPEEVPELLGVMQARNSDAHGEGRCGGWDYAEGRCRKD